MANQAKQHSAGGNIVFALTIFVIFILVFEGRLAIPLWLQPLGRMHPLLLHIPIVVILVAMGLEFFRFSSRAESAKDLYEKLTHHLLFIGVLLTGVTVVMGIFLAQEGGYQAETLNLHRWTGVAVFFVSAFIYVFRNRDWYSAHVAKAGSLVTCLLLITAGYMGGTVTHGDNFFLQPVMSSSVPVAVPLEQALVFEHVVKPVFAAKCLSCHNMEKQKGKLLLVDSAGLLRGGKNGKLFVAGNAEESLLLQRLHLPMEDKKHMPPSEKPQLTKEELSLLYYWIKSGADFNSRVVELQDEDTLRIVASRVLESFNEKEEVYTFPPVAESTLEKLNSNYRVIRPVALNSPALTVNIYNRDVYSPQTLEELRDVKIQVVSLDVARMPVTDAEMKQISRFENLQRLNLNFTTVTGKSLAILHPLKNLTSLSLSGTSLHYDDLRQALPGFQNLKTVAIWGTALSPDEMRKLQDEFKHITFPGESTEEEALIKLNPPRLKNKIRVFDDSISLDLFHPVNGVDIRFTVDGSEPDSLTSEVFRGNTIISESTGIKARAYKDGWLSSDVSTLNVYRSSLKPDTAMLLSRLNRVHPANGARTFFDHELGSFNANSPAWANNWAGFLRNDMELLLHYRTQAAVSSVHLNMLIETETSIFPPSVIEVWGGDSPSKLRIVTRKQITLPTVYKKPYIELIGCEFPTQRVSYLKIVAKPVMKLPEWHKNKDKPALILIDEILIN